MVIGKIKPTATIVAQFAAGVEVDAIQHDGKLYLPVVGMGDFATKDEPLKPSTSTKDEPAPVVDKKGKSDAPASDKTYTEDELMDMDVKTLTKILKDDFDIDPNDYDGKNTNKKLRGLILEAQEGSDDEDGADDEDDKKPESDSDAEGDELTDKIADILEDFDAGKKNKKKSIATICALVDDADEDSVTELVEKFESDADVDLDDMASKIADALTEEKKPKSSPKRSPKKAKESLVSVDDLEVGDRVSVWWDDDNQEWFDGEVKSIKKGKVIIAYDDDTEEAIDPEVHTKIKRLAE